jgi:hypothetical protein
MKYEEQIWHEAGIANGAEYKRAEFNSFEELEQFFLQNLWGKKGIKSKVIGKVLIWSDS